MWVMTTTAFLSAVEHREDAALLMVRARDETSLLNLAHDLGYEAEAVYRSLPSDYPYRLVVPKVEYARWCHDQVLAIGYDNFKARATKERGGVYVTFLHAVWSAGLALTDAATRKLNDAAWDELDRDWDRS